MLRRYRLTSLLVLMVYPVFLSTGTTFGVKEYCERESFEASCGGGEVILIRSAIFGRMSLGRCVENGYGHLGCSADVMAEVESQCSGRQRCQFPVSNLQGTRPCPSELISFLQASYDCVKVTTCAEHSCTSGNSIKVTNSEGYLASLVTSSSSCGSDLCPWVLEALPGQRFNLTFRSFVRIQADAKQQLGGRFCQRLATVFERSSQVSKDVTLCDNDANVVRIMTSAHEEVKLKIYYGTPENPAHFVVHYQVVGCADLEVPEGGWVKRTADSATVGCHGRPTTWHLTCNGITWTGDIGRCRNPLGSLDVTPNWSVQAAMEKAGATTEGILLVVGLGVIIGVVVGCSLLSVVIIIIKRRRRKQAKQYERRLELLTHYSPGVSSDATGKLYDPKSNNACDFAQVGQSLMYDSGFGTYEAHGYTSTQPSCNASNFNEPQNGSTSCGSKVAETTNCAIHGDHMYESHNFST